MTSSAKWAIWAATSILGCMGGFAATLQAGESAETPSGGTPTVKAENVVLISLDGLRGEEVFGGADQRLMLADLGVKDKAACLQQYGGETRAARRQKLLPFLWSRVEAGAWIAGDLESDSQIRVTNGRYFSYPGYNELLCGFGDPRIDSNDKRYNPNTSVLEWLHGQAGLGGSVYAFCSWDVFPFIINDRRSNIPVNAGWMPLTVGNPEKLAALNYAADNLFHEWDGVRYDAFTCSGALEAIRARQPRVVYVSFGETDDWAHAGRYDRYLLTARQNDGFIRDLWQLCQSLPQYRDRTAFIVTSDHGRGDGREGWKNHSDKLAGSEFIWAAAWGAGVQRSGIDQGGRFQQAQIAATVASVLGKDFASTNEKVRPALPLNESAR